jgi:hypothetical protein
MVSEILTYVGYLMIIWVAIYWHRIARVVVADSDGKMVYYVFPSRVRKFFTRLVAGLGDAEGLEEMETDVKAIMILRRHGNEAPDYLITIETSYEWRIGLIRRLLRIIAKDSNGKLVVD